jgi:hypothetical protein
MNYAGFVPGSLLLATRFLWYAVVGLRAFRLAGRVG